MKRINDTLGHKVGDQALTDTTMILRQTFRDSDIMARIGGDEFVILATDSSLTKADYILIRLKENLDNYNAREGRPYKLSFSVGVATYDPLSSYTIDELMIQADQAMYEQKRAKRKTSPSR
jgi:diguanylate cyclase (GGDEF)-like protein